MNKKKTKNTVNYVDNKKFFEEIIKHYQEVEKAKGEGKQTPKIPDYIGECIMKIALKLSNHPWFANYSFKDEMISDGIENSILYFYNFNPEKTQNPFAYFTQIIYYAFRRRILKEEKNRYTIYKNFQETISDQSLLLDGDDNSLMPSLLYDNINEFMDKFEKKEEEKKKKRKEMKNQTSSLTNKIKKVKESKND